MLPARTSPTANTPGWLASSSSGARASGHFVTAAPLRFDGRRGIVDAAAFKLRETIERRLPVLGAGGDDDGPRAHARAAVEADAVRLVAALQPRRRPRHGHLRAELLRLG